MAILCLASGPDAECRVISIGPLEEKQTCRALYADLKAKVAEAEGVIHFGARCEWGWAG